MESISFSNMLANIIVKPREISRSDHHIFIWNCLISTFNKIIGNMLVIVFVAIFFKIITITRMDYMTFYSSNFTVFIPTSCLLKLSSSISNIDEYRKIYYLLCSIISPFLPIILLCIANTISTCILVEVSFYISTVW